MDGGWGSGRGGGGGGLRQRTANNVSSCKLRGDPESGWSVEKMGGVGGMQPLSQGGRRGARSALRKGEESRFFGGGESTKGRARMVVGPSMPVNDVNAVRILGSMPSGVARNMNALRPTRADSNYV